MKLSRRHKRFLYGISILIFTSGLVWFFADRLGGEAHSWNGYLSKIHGMAAMAYLIVLGTMFPMHIKRSWKADVNRKNGVFLLGINLILVLSAYGLYYSGGEYTHWASYWIHSVFGLVSPLLLYLHIRIGKKSVLKKKSERYQR